MAETRNKIKYLVADTTAFINAVPLNEYAENVLTVPDVINEVRSRRQIRRLCVLPFDLQTREPRPESLKHCVEFAKKTGDYASLSGIDIKVIALAYELEVENVGTEHLRTQPIVSKTIASKDKPEEFQDSTKLVGWYNPTKDGDSEDSEDSEEEVDSDEETEEIKSVDLIKEAIEKQIDMDIHSQTIEQETVELDDEISQEELDKLFEKLNCETLESEASSAILVSQGKIGHNDSCTEDSAEEENLSETEAQKNNANDYNEDDGWITPSNIKKVKKVMEGMVDEDVIPIVACMSTDFAIQNTLKQMNLQISALNGRVITHLRTYILRCYACYKTTSIMTKVFCPNCGNKTLKKVAVSLDENGKQVIHINTRRPLSKKYKNQSLPRFHGGKHSHNPILFEDQPIPRQMPSRVAKTKTKALDDDYIAGLSPFVMRDVDSKSAMLRSKGHVKEWARNSNYEEDRRKKKYNRLYK